MMPVVNVEGTKDSHETCQQQQQQHQSRSSSRKWVVRSAVLITFTVLVTGVVLGCVYFGMAVTGDHKETWAQFMDNNGHLVDQKITATGTEEDYETPSMRAIYDSNTLLITYKFTEDLSGNCYLARLNKSEVDITENAVSNLTERWGSTNGPRHKNVRTSSIEVPREVLSPRGQVMCKFSKIYWLVADTERGHTRDKRQAAAGLMASYCCCRCGCCCSCVPRISQSMEMSLIE